MKTRKKTYILYATALIISSLFAGCEKEDTSAEPKTIEGLLYYYTDEVNNKIRVVDLDPGTPFRRSFTLSNDVTLEDIAKEREELVLKVYRPATVSPIANKKGLLIKSKVVENNWLYVANNPFVGLTGTSDDGWWEAGEFSNDATGFILHKSEGFDGEELYAIESVGYPGRYFTHAGHPIQGANLLYLDVFDDPEKAPKFRLYRTKANFTEGNPNVPRDAYFAW
jgi:hypothetical protein